MLVCLVGVSPIDTHTTGRISVQYKLGRKTAKQFEIHLTFTYLSAAQKTQRYCSKKTVDHLVIISIMEDDEKEKNSF